MRAIITSCTDRIFSKEPMPLAHLTFGEVCAVNDNKLRIAVSSAVCPRHQPRSVLASHAAQRLTQKRVRRLVRTVLTPRDSG